MPGERIDSERKRKLPYPGLLDLALFAFLLGLTAFGAWIASTGRVGYIFVMLVIAGALAYAFLDLMDYQVVSRKRLRLR